MDHRIARARPLGRALTATMAAAGLFAAAACSRHRPALAQQPPKPATPKPAAAQTGTGRAAARSAGRPRRNSRPAATSRS